MKTTRKLKVIRKEFPKIRERFRNGVPSYEIDGREQLWKEMGGQQWATAETQANAITIARNWAKQRAEGLPKDISPEDVKLLARLRRKLVPFKIGLEEAVHRYVEGLQKTVAIQKTETVAVVVDKWVASKPSTGEHSLRPDTLKQINDTAKRLKKMYGERPIGSITHEEIKADLLGMDIKAASQRIYLRMFRGFFIFAQAEKFIKSNPTDDIKIKVKDVPPEILDKEDIITLLGNALQIPEILPYIVVGLFAGVRPSETERLTWEDIFLNEMQIHVPVEKSKTIDRRVPIHDNLKEWLLMTNGRPFEKSIAYFNKVRKGVKWQQDILRHTAVSYFMAKYDNADWVSQRMGNSPQEIRKDYQRNVMPEQRDFFWSLTPEKVKTLIQERERKKWPFTSPA